MTPGIIICEACDTWWMVEDRAIAWAANHSLDTGHWIRTPRVAEATT